MRITNVIVEYYNNKNKPRHFFRTYIDVENVTSSYVMNTLPREIEKDIKLISNIEIYKTMEVQQ